MIPMSVVWVGKANIFGNEVVFYKDISTDEYWGFCKFPMKGKEKPTFEKWSSKPKCLN